MIHQKNSEPSTPHSASAPWAPMWTTRAGLSQEWPLIRLSPCPTAPGMTGYIQIQSMDFPDEEYFHVDHVPEQLPGFWGNYIRGAVLSLKRNFVIKKGFTGEISGKLPIGGLSSSAAVSTAYLMALCDVNDIKLTGPELVQYSHWIETAFIGLKNGILDQAANILSRDNHLLSIDCLTGGSPAPSPEPEAA